MLRESESIAVRPSNFRPDKNVTKKSECGAGRILFSDLVAFVLPGDKPEVWLAERTGKDERTARRWLDGSHAASGGAIGAVLAELLLRLK